MFSFPTRPLISDNTCKIANKALDEAIRMLHIAIVLFCAHDNYKCTPDYTYKNYCSFFNVNSPLDCYSCYQQHMNIDW